MKRKYRKIFQNELYGWYEDFTIPTMVSFKRFNEWFNWEYLEESYDTMTTCVYTEKL